MREREIEKLLVRYVKFLGGRAYKFVSPGNAGVPDRIVILPGGRVDFVELKTDTGQLSRIQQAQINRLRSLGCNVSVVKGVQGLAVFFHLLRYPEIEKEILEKYGGDADGV
ncbi:VRR-NUC domain-containing protein [Eubacterium pyruvativorans]|uniref:VRR-NUC domain-containing protein n=1 Tax=Eubacterium pyruvativorans TaxID=155865 RepID=UPI003F8AD420